MHSARPKSKWLATFGMKESAQSRLFCLPFAGGACTIYRDWPAGLPDVEVLPVQLPGRGARVHDPLFTDMTDLVGELADSVEPFLDRPFSIFGHCMGSLIGFELARVLRERGLPEPEHLFAAGRRAPQLPLPGERVAHLPDEDLIAEIRRAGGTPDAVAEQEALLRFYLPAIRADLKVCETYQYVPDRPLDCKITALGGTGDQVSLAELDAWRLQTRSAFDLTMIDGDHFFVQHCEDELLGILHRALIAPVRAGR